MNQENVALEVRVFRFTGPGGSPGHTTVASVYWSSLLPVKEGRQGGGSLLAPRCKGPDSAGLELGSCMGILPREQ